MFIFSIKPKKKAIFAVLAVILVALSLLIVLTASKGEEVPTIKQKEEIMLSTNEERRDFLRRFGWETSEEPIEIVEITIPAEFNEVYKNYNDIQKKQGFNLEQYKSKSAKRYTYQIKNYPNVSDEVRANLIIADDRLIGGDVMTTRLNGFMHGFSIPKKLENEGE